MHLGNWNTSNFNKRVLSTDFSDEATCHVINGPNYSQRTDGAVYVPDMGIKISLKVFGNPICDYIGTCILCLQNISRRGWCIIKWVLTFHYE